MCISTSLSLSLSFSCTAHVVVACLPEKTSTPLWCRIYSKHICSTFSLPLPFSLFLFSWKDAEVFGRCLFGSVRAFISFLVRLTGERGRKGRRRRSEGKSGGKTNMQEGGRKEASAFLIRFPLLSRATCPLPPVGWHSCMPGLRARGGRNTFAHLGITLLLMHLHLTTLLQTFLRANNVPCPVGHFGDFLPCLQRMLSCEESPPPSFFSFPLSTR